MRHRSFQKKMTTAAIVPSWMTAVTTCRDRPSPNRAGTIRRWAEDEIGRNSVSPWTIPSTMAWMVDMAWRRYP